MRSFGLDSVLLTEGCILDPCYVILRVTSPVIVGAPNCGVAVSSPTGLSTLLAQAVRYRPVNAEVRVRSQVRPCVVCGG